MNDQKAIWFSFFSFLFLLLLLIHTRSGSSHMKGKRRGKKERELNCDARAVVAFVVFHCLFLVLLNTFSFSLPLSACCIYCQMTTCLRGDRSFISSFISFYHSQSLIGVIKSRICGRGYHFFFNFPSL